MKKLALLLILLLTMIPLKAFSETELPTEPGTYPAEASYIEDGKKLQKTVYVTVKGEDTVIVGDIAIDAKSFVLTPQQVKRITAKKAIDYSEAKAWSTIDGTERIIRGVDLSELQPIEGVYDVTFSTAGGVSKTVNATVGEALLGNRDFNSYDDSFEASYWRVLLAISIFLAVILATPLLIVLFSSRNIVQIVQELTDFFSR